MGKIFAPVFSLKETLECGQIFRFEKAGGHYYLVVGSTALKLRQEGSWLHYESSDDVGDDYVRKLFMLDADYPAIISSISKDDYISSAIARSHGLRIIRQEPYECLVSYICSANSSVARVKSCADALSGIYGRKIMLGSRDFIPSRGRSSRTPVSCAAAGLATGQSTSRRHWGRLAGKILIR